MSYQPGVLDSSCSFSLVNDSLEIGCLSTTRKILGTGELNDMDKVARIAIRPMSVAESEPPENLDLFNFDAEVDNIFAPRPPFALRSLLRFSSRFSPRPASTLMLTLSRCRRSCSVALDGSRGSKSSLVLELVQRCEELIEFVLLSRC